MLVPPELDPALQGGVSHESGAEGENPPLALLPTLLWVQPSTRLAFWAVSARCWLTVSFPSTNTPKPFSSGLLSIHSSPRLY